MYLRFLGMVLCLVFRPAASGSGEEQLLRIQQFIQRAALVDARSELREALKRSPLDPRLYNFLGVVDAQERNFIAAESNFRRAIQIAPRFAGAYLNLGRLYQENKAGEKALEVYRRLLRLEPDHFEANYQAAWLLNRLGSFSASEQHLARLPEPAQHRPQALALRCANYTALGKASQAETIARLLEAHVDLAESDVLPLVAVLDAHRAGGLATELLEVLVRRGLASSQALQRLSVAYESQRRFAEARQAQEKAAQLEPVSAPMLVRLARLAHQTDDRKATLGYLAHARDLEPANAAIHFFFGMVCVELDVPREAKDSLQEAVRLDPKNPYYNYALGALLVQEKNANQALPCFQKFYEARPDDPRGKFALGVVYFHLYNLEAARRELEAATGHADTRMGAHLFLGRLGIREGNLEQAADHLGQAIQANPSVPEPYAELGLVSIRRREYAAAEKNLARAVQLAPDHYLGNLYLLMLYQRNKDPRAAAQAQRIEQIKNTGDEKERLLIRTLKIQPY